MDDCALLLLRRGVNIHAVTKNGENALHLAARKGYGRWIKKLLELHVDPCKMNVDNCTPVRIASLFKRKKCLAMLEWSCPYVKCVCAQTTNLTCKDAEGYTELNDKQQQELERFYNVKEREQKE
jgi:ankyrin repeat protein